jgi:hypothetical protein
MAHTMTNKTNKANNVRVLRPSWRAAGEVVAQAQARRVREQSEHTPFKGCSHVRLRPVVASKLEASDDGLDREPTWCPPFDDLRSLDERSRWRSGNAARRSRGDHSEKAMTFHHCAASPSLARIVAVTNGLPAFEVRRSGARKSAPKRGHKRS